jgi:hypothetical protein
MDREEVLRQSALIRMRIKIIEQKALKRLKENREMPEKNRPAAKETCLDVQDSEEKDTNLRLTIKNMEAEK